MSAKKATSPGKPDFESSAAELEGIVRRLEAGDLPLEDSLTAFEKGVSLVKALHSRLDAVQMRIDELTQGAGGKAELRPFASPGDEADDGDDDE